MIFQIRIARRDDGACLAGNADRESQQDVTNRVGARILLVGFSEVFWNQIFFGTGVLQVPSAGGTLLCLSDIQSFAPRSSSSKINMTSMRALFHSSLSVFAMLVAFCAVPAACGQDAANANPVSSISSGETSADSLENWSEYVPVKDSLIGSIRIHGSETLQGIVEVLAADFQRLYPEVSFEMRPEGSLLAIAGFAEGEDIIGTYSGLVGEQEKKALQELGINDILHIPLATDHIAVVVHPTNPLTSLSLVDLKSLFSAESGDNSKTLWKKLTGEEGPQLVGPGFLSGTRSFFQARVLGEGKEFSSLYTAADRNAEILREIAASPKAIGFLTASSIDDSVRVLGLSETESAPAILPDFQEADSAKYPLERTLHLLVRTTGEHRLSRLDQEFIKYALSRQGALAIQRARFMPIDAELAAKTLSKVLEIETR